jgi:hypothetical protein
MPRYHVGREESVPHDSRCAVPGRVPEPGALRQRIRKLEEELREHDLEEGYEWPCSEQSEQEQSREPEDD